MEVKLVLNPNKLKGDKQNLSIRFTENRKVNYINLGIKVKPSDFKDGRLKNEFLNENEVVQKQIVKAEKIIIEMINEGFTGFPKFKELFEYKEKIKTNTLNQNFYTYSEQLLNELLKNQKLGNYEVYKLTINKLKKYYYTLNFSDITVNFLEELKIKMTNEGLKGNSQSIFFRTIAAIFNRAIADKLIDFSIYPFKNTLNPRGFSPNSMKTNTKHRVLDDAEIDKIKKYVPDTFNKKLAKDMFLFSYYSSGMNITDIALLKESNIINDRIIYIRAKTSMEYNIKITEEIKKLLMKYNCLNKPYLFPIINPNYTNPSQLRDRIKKVRKNINSNLKEIAASLGINKPLTTYWARHTMASKLQRNNVNIAIISKALGHTSLKTTQIYLEGFGNNVIDEVLETIL
jgi:site-specific recombinase XerD